MTHPRRQRWLTLHICPRSESPWPTPIIQWQSNQPKVGSALPTLVTRRSVWARVGSTLPTLTQRNSTAGRKPTSNPCHAKINPAKGRKPTSYPRPCKQFIFVSICCLSMHKQTYCRPPAIHHPDTHLSIRNNLCLCEKPPRPKPRSNTTNAHATPTNPNVFKVRSFIANSRPRRPTVLRGNCL